MSHFFSELTLSFVPLFFAMNIIGVVPIYLNITEELSGEERRNLTRNACFAVLGVSVLFIFAGRALFSSLGITPDDFRVGGGIILLVISIVDLVFKQGKSRRDPGQDVGGLGVVPVGIPLIVGPAALTTLLMLVDKFGYFMTIVVLAINLAIVYGVFSKSHLIVRVLRPGGIKVFSKITSLFLAAIAVMMIRVGIVNIISLS
jgi:multiple antibiotic resistance protein